MQGFCFFIFSILVQYLWTLLKFFSSFDFLLQEKQLPNIFDASLFSIYNAFCHLNPISGLEYPQFHVLLNLVLIQKSTKKVNYMLYRNNILLWYSWNTSREEGIWVFKIFPRKGCSGYSHKKKKIGKVVGFF